MPKPPKDLRSFESLMKVVEHLRGPEGCPWDKEQTQQTLTRFAIEEAHELADAIDSGDRSAVVEELGDLLLQVVLHAEIGRQAGQFQIEDVIAAISEKMVRRHPHVFADVKVNSSQEVLKNWAEIKAEEKAAEKAPKSTTGSPFDIPKGMPALLRSQKIGEKTRKIHFDWSQAEEVWEKVEEEIAELKDAFQNRGSARDPQRLERVESELGDVLFSLAQLARHLELDSEQALRKTNQRFERRFALMQNLVAQAGRDWNTLSPEERESFWQKAKAADAPSSASKTP